MTPRLPYTETHRALSPFTLRRVAPEPRSSRSKKGRLGNDLPRESRAFQQVSSGATITLFRLAATVVSLLVITSALVASWARQTMEATSAEREVERYTRDRQR